MIDARNVNYAEGAKQADELHDAIVNFQYYLASAVSQDLYNAFFEHSDGILNVLDDIRYQLNDKI